MPKMFRRFLPFAISLLLAGLFISTNARATMVTINVPPLASQSTAYGFEFTSFDFKVYMTGGNLLDCAPGSDICPDVVANLTENYTDLKKLYCGRYCTPTTYTRVSTSNYIGASVANPFYPTGVDVFFQFSGADVAGQSLNFAVNDPGNYSLKLFDDTNTQVALGSVFGTGTYTLEYTTDSISSLYSFDEIIATTTVSSVPLPASVLLMLSGIVLLTGVVKRKRSL